MLYSKSMSDRGSESGVGWIQRGWRKLGEALGPKKSDKNKLEDNEVKGFGVRVKDTELGGRLVVLEGAGVLELGALDPKQTDNYKDVTRVDISVGEGRKLLSSTALRIYLERGELSIESLGLGPVLVSEPGEKPGYEKVLVSQRLHELGAKDRVYNPKMGKSFGFDERNVTIELPVDQKETAGNGDTVKLQMKQVGGGSDGKRYGFELKRVVGGLADFNRRISTLEHGVSYKNGVKS